MCKVGDKVYFLNAKDDVREAVVSKLNGVNYCTVEFDGTSKRIEQTSTYATYERAMQANKSYTKKQGGTEVYPFWHLEDIKKMVDGFHNRGMYHWECAFYIGLLMGRRVSDIMTLKWRDFYAENGARKRELNIIEEKTGKQARLFVPPFMFKVLEDYCTNTGASLKANIENDAPLFPSRSKRADAAYRTAFKNVAADAKIEYPVSTHSVRKTFGLWSRRLHPQDVNSMQILQKFFNHSDVQTTSRYIGLDAQQEQRYIQDMSDMIERVAGGDTEFVLDNRPVISLKADDLREIIAKAFCAAHGADTAEDIGILNGLYALAEDKAIATDTL